MIISSLKESSIIRKSAKQACMAARRFGGDGGDRGDGAKQEIDPWIIGSRLNGASDKTVFLGAMYFRFIKG